MQVAPHWILLVCAAGVASCGVGEKTPGSLPLHARTIAILEGGRAYDARLSPGQRYTPCVTTSDTSVIPGIVCRADADHRLLERAASLSVEISAALARQSSTDALWSSALLDLWSAPVDARTIDRAIRRLAEVSARVTGPLGAAVLSDLAVAHLVRASVRDDPADLFSAVEYIERAYASDSTRVTIRFNRAIVLERARIDRQAADSWRTLADSATPWGREAGDRYRRLAVASNTQLASFANDSNEGAWSDGAVKKVVRRDPQLAREFVLDTLATRWARAAEERRLGEAATTLRNAESIGRALLTSSGDSSALHAVKEMRSDTRVSHALGQGVEGIARFRETRYAEARPLLAAAVRSLRGLRASALADWIELNLGGLAIYRADYAAAERTFALIARRARERGDIALEARSNWGLALSRGRRGAMSDVEIPYRVAADDFQRIGETSNYAFMQALVADIHSALGRSDASARAAYAALDAFHRRKDVGQRYAMLLALGHRLSEAGDNYAATATVREAVIEAATTGRVKDVPEALSRLATVEAELGDGVHATRTIALARERAAAIADSAMHARIDVELSRAEARVHRQDNPALAVVRLDQVAAYFAKVGIPSDEAPALVERATIRLTMGDSASAELDLRAATERVATFAASGSSRETVRHLVTTQRGAYHQLSAIALARGDSTAAYQYAALSRSAETAPRLSRAITPATTASGSALLEYLVLDDRTLLWTTTPAGRRLTTIRVTRQDLANLVARFVNLIRQGEDTLSEIAVGNQIARLLIEPIRGALEGARTKRLVLVGDGPLVALPFAALRTSGGRYLAEEFALTYAESGTNPRVAQDVPTGARRNPLLIGNPQWDRLLFPELEELHRTDVEVRGIGAMYERPVVLAGAAASRSALLREIARHDVVHFAGHARVLGDNPGASHLVLAREDGGFGANVLYASEIARLDLRGAPLVVLSACGESGDRYTQSEGNGLVLAFLDAGARGVIASEWEADDDATAVLTRVLHRELRTGTPADEALRRAQAALLSGSQGRPFAASRMWSGFRYSVESDAKSAEFGSPSRH